MFIGPAYLACTYTLDEGSRRDTERPTAAPTVDDNQCIPGRHSTANPARQYVRRWAEPVRRATAILVDVAAA